MTTKSPDPASHTRVGLGFLAVGLVLLAILWLSGCSRTGADGQPIPTVEPIVRSDTGYLVYKWVEPETGRTIYFGGIQGGLVVIAPAAGK